MNTVKTQLMVCLWSSQSHRYIAACKRIEFPGFIPVGYSVSLDDRVCVGKVVDSEYDIVTQENYTTVGRFDSHHSIFTELRLFEIGNRLLQLGFEMEDEDYDDGEPPFMEVIEGTAKSKFAPGWNPSP